MDIRETILKNRDIIIAVGVGLVVIVIILISQLPREESGSTETFISPISTESGTVKSFGSIEFSSSAHEFDSLSLPVYSADPFSFSDVQRVLSNLGMGSVTPIAASGDTAYYWERGDDFARYDMTTGAFVLVSSPISLDADTLEVDFSAGTVDEYFVSFVSNYVNEEVPISVESEMTSEGYRVRGAWLLGDYPVTEKYGQTYSVLATFDEQGRLLSLYASLMKFEAGDSEVEIMPTQDLRSYVNYETYPKEAYIDIVADEYSCEENCDPYTLDEVESFQQAEIDRVDIVYYYAFSTREVLPVYKLSGEGISYSGDESSTVSVVIYANAIDPDQIIIPSGE